MKRKQFATFSQNVLRMQPRKSKSKRWISQAGSSAGSLAGSSAGSPAGSSTGSLAGSSAGSSSPEK